MNDAPIPQYDESIPQPTRTFYSLVVKRCLSVILSGMALLVLSPVYLILAVLEWIIHGRPAIYRSRRPGKDGKIFVAYKFRSMTNERDENGDLLPEERRLTKFGRFLRKTSLDELPQIYNIFKGDMAIIGPRPLLIEYLDYYTPRHAMRQSVRPGLVCLTRKGGGPVTWRQQFESDIEYIQHITFWNDVKMLFALVGEVLKGSSYREEDSRVPFTGDNLDETHSKEELGQHVLFDSINH